MLGVILGIISFIIVLIIDINSDYKRILTNTINHKRGTILRTVGLLPSFGCFYFPLENIQWWHWIIKGVIIIGLFISVWWEFFDGFLNKKRGYSWRFNGSKDKDDPEFDKILYRLKPYQQGILKWSLITLFIISYILYDYYY